MHTANPVEVSLTEKQDGAYAQIKKQRTKLLTSVGNFPETNDGSY